jgi:hypothetical protein
MKDMFKRQKAEHIRQQRAAAKEKKRTAGCHFTCIAQQSCGCCNTGIMHFRSKESAIEAFTRHGMTSSVTVVDDTGARHERVDTFYGFRPTRETQPRSLNYLAKLITG